jgi:hypothetical protein
MRTTIFALAAGAALTLCHAAEAQPFPALAPGQVVQEQLGSDDPQLTEHGPFQVYQVRAMPGVRYIAWMDSDDFDAYLTLGRTVGGITDYVRTDDDGGEGTNSRLRFTVPAAGTYLIIARSLGEGGRGAFRLGLDTVSVRPAPVRDVALGETVRGTFSESDAELEDDDGFYHLFRFSGTAGQRIRAAMEGDDLSPMPEIGMMDGDAFIPLEEQGGSYGEFTLATLPATGTYYVRAIGWGTGDYALTVEDRPVVPLRAQPIQRGTDVAGTLGAGDGELDDGRMADAYTFTGRAGERVRITLASEDFDAYLLLGRMENGAFQRLTSNDDAGEGLDSAIDFTLPADGEYVIHATSFGSGAEGAYVVRLEP